MDFYLIFSSILLPIPPWERGTARPDGGRRLRKISTSSPESNVLSSSMLRYTNRRRSAGDRGGVHSLAPTLSLCKSSHLHILNPHPRRSVHQSSLLLILLVGHHPLPFRRRYPTQYINSRI